MKRADTCGKCGKPKNGKCKDCSAAYNRNYHKTHPALNKWNNARDGLLSRCRKRGITVEQYSERFKEQEGKCAICGCELQDGKGAAGAAIDHNHQTNQFRGILCALCNKALGGFKEDVQILRKAIEYILRWSHSL